LWADSVAVDNVSVLTIDEGWRGGVTRTCECCGHESERTWCMVNSDAAPYAVFFAACYDHGAVRESWIDVVFGTWGQGAEYDDHVSFGCRFGPVGNAGTLAATAVDAASVAPDNSLFGRKLSRSAALSHSMLPEFWQVVDFVLATDPLLHRYHYDHDARLIPDLGNR
jgi:hypothetical protein